MADPTPTEQEYAVHGYILDVSNSPPDKHWHWIASRATLNVDDPAQTQLEPMASGTSLTWAEAITHALHASGNPHTDTLYTLHTITIVPKDQNRGER